VAVLSQPTVPVNILVDDDSQVFHNLKAAVASIGIRSQSGFQFLHSMREFIHVYVFTERVGDIALNGYAFMDSCDPVGPQDGPQLDGGCVLGQTGLERLQRWYECNRITSRASAITIAFGPNTSYDCFLVGMNAELTAADMVTKFAMQFKFIPRTVDGSDVCFGADDFGLADFYERDVGLADPCVAVVPKLTNRELTRYRDRMEHMHRLIGW
jgi:hypothetical protein